MSRVSDHSLRDREHKKRDSLEIVRDMLSAASVKIRKTRLMYQTHLSYRLMTKYLKPLLDNGLLEHNEDSYYLTTSKGKRFLQMYEDYIERSRRVGEEISGVHEDLILLKNMYLNNELNSKQMESEKEVPV